jgi:hypothetical protein
LARVQRLLGEEIAMAVAKRVARQEFVDVGAVEGVAKTPGFRDVTLDGGVGLEGDLETGETVETVEECGVERKAEVGERLELRRVVGVVSGEHSGSGGGGLGEWSGTIEYDDGHASVVEFKGEGEADDAGSGDTDVGMAHGLSLE